jgi:hypothetical protein
MPWFIGAALLGVLLPALLAAITMIAGYCPMGSALPRELPWGHFGVILLIFGMSAIILCAAPIYALLAWHWRPLALGAIFAVGAVVGFVPGTMAGNYVQNWAFDLFDQRSAGLVGAIQKYELVNGGPPRSLAELVPEYLPTIPMTGRAAAPDYRYEAKGGPCSDQNAWHVWVSVPQFIDMDRLLYCPKQDYAPAGDEVLSRTAVGTWVYDHIDF